MSGTVLLIEDDVQMRGVLSHYLRRSGFAVLEAGTCAEGRQLQAAQNPDLTIVDYELPDGTAFDVLEAARQRDRGDAHILLTGVGTIELAVQAIKAGAEHFLTKPVDLESLGILVRRTLEAQRSRRERALSVARRRPSLIPFLGESRAIRELEAQAKAMLDSEAPVLIRGETGAGKGVLARWFHEQGSRAREPFVDLSCAGLTRELAESQLFGHGHGAFTGATSAKPGLMEIAHRGTLFLDEIGDLDLAVQPKLLKALDEGSFRRLGETTERSANVRLLTATHHPLDELVRRGAFREDLLFRLNTLTLEVPPLRERIVDLPELARAVLSELCARAGRSERKLGSDALAALAGYAWPGNIRELRNVLERALLFSKGDVLDRSALRFDRALGSVESELPAQTLEDVERRHIAAVLRRSAGRVEQAAEVLDVSRSALYAKLKKYGLSAQGE
jgi:DNA-binding NtrC family response regulator